MYALKNNNCQYNLTLSSRFTSLANHQAIVVKKEILATLHSVNVKTNNLQENSSNWLLQYPSCLLTFWEQEVDVNCSKKHCHSKDLSQRQCQRFSMIFPTDNKIEILLWEAADLSRFLYFFLCFSANWAHWTSTVLINWLWDSMSWCKTWNKKYLWISLISQVFFSIQNYLKDVFCKWFHG